MPRSPRADEAGGIYHALNRANLGAKIFRKEGDFVAFEKLLGEALLLHQIELFAYQIMTTHWHLILRPLVDGEMGRFCKWVGDTHDAVSCSLPHHGNGAFESSCFRHGRRPRVRTSPPQNKSKEV